MAKKARSASTSKRGAAEQETPGSARETATLDRAGPEQGADTSRRLDVYVVDSGWHSAPHLVLRRSMGMVERYLTGHNLFVLTEEQSVAFLKKHPHLVGRDPLLVVVDPRARAENQREGFGASLVLGRTAWVLGRKENEVPDDKMLLGMIKMFLRLVNCHDGSKNIAGEFRKFNHKEGTKGILEIVMDSLGQEALRLGEA